MLLVTSEANACPAAENSPKEFPARCEPLQVSVAQPVPATSSGGCARSRDKDGQFARLLSEHVQGLQGVARRLAGNPAEADDLMQDTIVRAWSFRDRFHEGSNVRAWLRRIMVNTFINGYRKRRREQQLFREAGELEHRRQEQWRRQNQLRRDGVGDEVVRALGTLPGEFRCVVELVDLGEHSYREAASELGCPIGTVMSRLSRARKLLRSELADYGRREGYLRPSLSVA